MTNAHLRAMPWPFHRPGRQSCRQAPEARNRRQTAQKTPANTAHSETTAEADMDSAVVATARRMQAVAGPHQKCRRSCSAHLVHADALKQTTTLNKVPRGLLHLIIITACSETPFFGLNAQEVAMNYSCATKKDGVSAHARQNNQKSARRKQRQADSWRQWEQEVGGGAAESLTIQGQVTHSFPFVPTNSLMRFTRTLVYPLLFPCIPENTCSPEKLCNMRMNKTTLLLSNISYFINWTSINGIFSEFLSFDHQNLGFCLYNVESTYSCWESHTPCILGGCFMFTRVK